MTADLQRGHSLASSRVRPSLLHLWQVQVGAHWQLLPHLHPSLQCSQAKLSATSLSAAATSILQEHPP